MATATVSPARLKGGSFLLQDSAPEDIFTPEDFTDEHRAIAKTTEDFWNKEVAPNVEAIQHHEPGVAAAILRKSAELGLTGVILPEKFGGMEIDLTSPLIVAEALSKNGSYRAWPGAPPRSAPLPLLLFG